MEATLPSIRKGASILARPYFLSALVRHRVAAASEHLAPIRFCAANTLIDVGSNKGQFSLAFRNLRPHARIIAFEPLAEAADTYERVFVGDPLVDLHRVALAGRAGSARFHVTDRTDSSSLLRPGNSQERAFGVHYASTIEVSVKRLDDSVDVSALESPIMLKVDVQGGELNVFEGCASLTDLDFIYVELSFVELYEGQPLFQEVCDYLSIRGFAVAGLYNQVTTTEFGPTQVDALFKRVGAGSR
jgi:FkbM family methyltransferase